MRRQLSLFLPPDQRSVVEPIRQRLDPLQHAMIPAHVTLCRDDELATWPPVRDRLASLKSISITMQFGYPHVLTDASCCAQLMASSNISIFDGAYLDRQPTLTARTSHCCTRAIRLVLHTTWPRSHMPLPGSQQLSVPLLSLSKANQANGLCSRSTGLPSNNSFKPRPLRGLGVAS